MIFLIVIFVLLLGMSFHSEFLSVDSAGDDATSTLTPYLSAVFLILSAVTFLNLKIKNVPKFLKITLLIVGAFFVSILLPAGLGANVEIYPELRSLIIPMLGVLIGSQLELSSKTLRMILLIFIVCIAFSLLSQILANVGGFIITEQYATDLKNILGVIGATAVVLTVGFIINGNKNFVLKIFYLFLLVLLLVELLTLRARAATLIAFVASAGMVISHYGVSLKKVVITVVVLFAGIILTSLLIPDSVSSFIYDSFFLNQDRDFTSDRAYRNQKALEFIADNLWFGNLDGRAADFGWIHNYLLLQLFNFGILLSLPLILLYFYIAFVVLKNVWSHNINQIAMIGFPAMLVPLGISLAEPTLPYGPGTTTLINFILLGIALRAKQQI